MKQPAMADEATDWVQLSSWTRSVAVGMQRIYENALDWQRLPFVHRHAIAGVDCRSAGATGWRAEVLDVEGLRWSVRLDLNRGSRRWIAQAERDAGGRLLVRADCVPRSVDVTEVTVSLAFDPGLAASVRDRWAAVFDRAWSADAAMMLERQRQIDRRVEGAGADRQRDLGLRSLLTLPLLFEVGGREFVLAEVSGVLMAYPRRCPHLLGPLDDALEGQVLTCPWHGYRFDAVTGENLAGGPCRLSAVPAVACLDGRVVVTASH